MEYEAFYSESFARKMMKLKKKDSKLAEIVLAKVDWIRENPQHTFKRLRFGMKGLSRVHIGHFVLLFVVDHKEKTIVFEDYAHHDDAYVI